MDEQEQQSTSKTRHYGLTRRAAEIALAVGVVFVVFGVAVTASASEGDEWPLVLDYYAGDPSSRKCDEIAYDLGQDGYLDPDNLPTWNEFKIDPPADGSYPDPLGIEISNFDGNSFDWTSTVGIDLVYVKSGEKGSRLYLYDPPTEGMSGTDQGTTQDISHITFCYDDDQPVTTTTEAPTTTESTTTTTTESTTTTTEPGTTTTTTEPGTTTTTEPGTTTTTEPGTTTTNESTTTSVAPTSSEAPTTTTTTTTVAPSSSVPPTTAQGPTSSTPPEGPEVGGVKITRVEPESSSPLPVTGSAVGIPLIVVGVLVLLGGGLSLLAHRRTAAAEAASSSSNE